MGSVTAQIIAVVGMNIRSLPQRLWMSLATLFAVAIVVAVLLAFLAMGNGFKTTVENTGSESIAIVMRESSQAEINSSLMREQVNLIETAPGIARDENGPLISAELYVIVDGIKKSSQTKVNLPFRGLEQRGITMRENIRIVEGRMFESGRNEIMVGTNVLREFGGFELGKEVRLGNAQWTVVGVFDAGGSVFGSELWADARTIQSQFNRGNSYQTIRVALETPGDLEPIKEFIEADPRLNLDIKTEKEYFSEQASQMSDFIFYLGWPLAITMALGALAGALNTMYTSVAQRAKEIATLRAIGYSGTSAFFGTMVESIVLATIGGVLGTVAAFLFFDGLTASTLGGSFTQIVFDFRLSSDSLASGIKLAIIIGLLGGVFPAIRAARMPVIAAFSATA